ncbi:MAG: rRNA pseudouridine synthase, partial [Candidatus Pacebacteria bacterium]|nr:rRNA pseudouridine synthase [Candidatus Paceibacterota bacterium]
MAHIHTNRTHTLTTRRRSTLSRSAATNDAPHQQAPSSSAVYPMRINRYLAHQGYATRKKADELVAAGKVLLNGTPAVLGDKVSEHDTVRVLFHAPRKGLLYLAYNKPRGTVTHGAQAGEVEILDHIKKRDPNIQVFPVGRLDKNSHGLIILTNDGRIVEPMLSPERYHEKEYRVRVNERLRADVAELLSRGVEIGDYLTKPCRAERVDAHTLRIILTEGKNHQIKRMCDALGYTVRDLQRTRIMHIRLMRLRP